MKFEVNNVNLIKNSSLKLEGLTVIVGNNSTGKSTISRMLFSTIKAINESKKNQTNDLASKIKESVETLYKRIYTLELKDEKLFEYFPIPQKLFFNALRHTSDLKNFISERLEYVKSLDIEPRLKRLIENDFLPILTCIYEGKNKEIRFGVEIQNLIESEFLNNINQGENTVSEITFEMDKNNTLYFSLKDSVINQFEVTGNSFLEDATYVESPLYIHILDSLLNSTSYKEISSHFDLFKPMIPFHITDFVNKISSLKYLNNGNKNLIEELSIEKIIGGHFLFDEKTNKIEFSYGDKNISPINVASGVKTFGTIQMLLNGNFINPNKMLLWDEPENHLHPAWQIEFAKILVQLSKSGIPIVITTHSPYFLQAIRYYSVKYDIEKYVNYYTSEISSDNNSCNVKDVTEDLNEVFEKLASPLNDIMNIDELRELK